MTVIFILLLKATLLLSLSILLLLACRKASASLRHWIISLTLIGLILLPFLGNVVPNVAIEVPILKTEKTAQHSNNQLLETANSPLEVTLSKTAVNTNTAKSISPNLSKRSKNSKRINLLSPINPWQLLGMLWLIGTLFCLTRLGIGILKIHRLSKASQPFPRPFLSKKSVEVLHHKAIKTPMTWGFGRAKILLPTYALNWSEETLETVFLHELAHIQRKDYWIHILSLVSASFYWFHPMVWWMKKRQILEREKACDEQVLRLGITNDRYAQQLVNVARFLSQPSTNSTQYALPMAQISQLKQRVLAILSFRKESFRFSKVKQSQWAVLFVGLLVGLSAFTPIEKSKIVQTISAELPTLASVLPKSLNSQNTIGEIPSLSIPKRPIITPVAEIQTPNLAIKRTPTVNRLPTLQRPLVQSRKTSPTVIPKPISKQVPQGRFGTWERGNSKFRVSTIGDFRYFDTYPFIEVTDPDGMVVIEQFRDIGKTIRVVITKAPHAGAVVQHFHLRKPGSWSGKYAEGDNLHLWTIGGKWEFLSEHKLEKWMRKVLPELTQQLAQNTFLKDSDNSNSTWQTAIHRQLKLRKERFVSSADLADANLFHEESKTDKKFSWAGLPTRMMRAFRPVGDWRKIGKTIATGTTSGGCPINSGTKFGRIFRNLSPSILKSFNFNVKMNQHAGVNVALQLYQVQNNEITHKILEQPLEVQGINNDEHRWIRLDLSREKVAVEGDILAILEVTGVEGRRKNGCLFVSHGIGFYKSFQKQSPSNWGFYDENFAFYFTVKQ
ncbi:MAG: M56 family metallopeptidase [Bacteroidota bacterium]